MVVQHNLTAMNANRYLGINNNKLSKSLEKLSSGYQINRAGDNAAGLAVSEKMRSQIAGMTQGVKNAQDGISMVQTFEGALTETHSILQRMKTLADQMANGSYDDPIDRTAAQQEFLQLNDELDQIADTDFNGVVVLNGGQMADGTKAVNGQFDYKNGTAHAATKLGKDDINLLDGQAFDNVDAASKIKNADAFWNTLNPQWSRIDADSANDGPDSVDITFQYDKSSQSWKAISANNGANYNNVTVAQKGNGGFAVTTPTTTQNKVTFEETTVDALTAVSGSAEWYKDDKGNEKYTGGDEIPAGGKYYTKKEEEVEVPGAVLADVVIDETKVNNGDTITLTFKNPATGKNAPNNIGADPVDTSNFTEVIGAKQAIDMDLTTAIDNTVLKSEDMSADTKKLLELLDGADVTVNYKAEGNATIDAKGLYDMKVTLKDGTIFNFSNVAEGKNSTSTLSINGSTYDFKFTQSTDGTDAAKLEVQTGGNTMITFTTATNVAADTKNEKDEETKTYSTGNISYKIGLENYKYENNSVPSVEVAKTGSVSKSDAFNKSEAILTYKDNITLQVGARTKDAVNFTFQYASTSIGDLKDDLDCTSRGLGTAKLNINTQEAANYAIDKIDQAINKVSLIRGTFGAIQNRLEHKIDNMNVSIENLTSAESQIRDTNMPQEMMNFTKNQILAQASQAMLAQANQLPQNVLSLLR